MRLSWFSVVACFERQDGGVGVMRRGVIPRTKLFLYRTYILCDTAEPLISPVVAIIHRTVLFVD